ncbi:response regulator [Flavobacterium myungsuense]|uniref:Response regulator n=1 Tax=Flavobacterium myungsuense TaxID=651823 RepID=A0ABW3J5P0_9FLAO
MKKYLLIDDDHIFNLVHKRTIQIIDKDGEVIEFKDSVMALGYIKAQLDTGETLPDYIFLDISMPEMNGFELLDGLSDYPVELFAHTKLYIVTSSLNDRDMKKAFSYPMLTGYYGKPLSIEVIKGIVENH